MFNKQYNQYLNNKSTSMLVDVREPEEYQEIHLPESINIPLSSFNLDKIDINKTIYLYCRSGSRSENAKNILEKLGYKCINMGGIIDWKN